MPIYEYECTSCGHVLDALQKVSDDPLVHCPTCGEAALKKLLSAPRFRLKGSGWYETEWVIEAIRDYTQTFPRTIASGDSAKPSGDKSSETGKKEDGKPSAGKSASSAGKTSDAGD